MLATEVMLATADFANSISSAGVLMTVPQARGMATVANSAGKRRLTRRA